MVSETKRVLVIEDASKAAGQSAIRALLYSYSFQPGDKLMLLGIQQRIKNRIFTRAYRSKMDHLSSIFRANRRAAPDELAQKKEEYINDPEISNLSQKCRTSEIKFHVEVQVGALPKEIIVRAARGFGATWIILDRQMKKDKSYLMGQLSCRISAVKRNNAVKDWQRTRAKAKPKFNHVSIDVVRRSRGKEEFDDSVCSVCGNRRPKVAWRRNFTYEEIQDATEKFSPKNFITESPFGFVYKGELNGLQIAVKKIKTSGFEQDEFASSFSALSELRHDNLAVLLGVCVEGNSGMLVYEYVCNGSLEHHLSKSPRRPLKWDQRMKIAFGAAKALKYLHENKIVHGKFRPSNILLSHDLEARVGNFGLSTLEHGASIFSSHATLSKLVYYAPEYAKTGKASTKTDCYAFGVMLLQLITGLGTSDRKLGGKNIVSWAKPLLKDKNYPILLDQTIGDSYDIHQVYWIVRVVEACLRKDPRLRASMDQVFFAFSSIMEGKTVQVLRNCSPSGSESISSHVDTSESTSDDKRPSA